MNNIISISILIFLILNIFSCSSDKVENDSSMVKSFSEPVGMGEIPEGAIMLDDNTIINNENDEILELNEAMKLLDSGDWTMDPVENSNGEIAYLQLRKMTEDEKKMMMEMPSSDYENKMIGEKAPEFEVKDIYGNSFSSEKLKGKIVVLNFWFIKCKPCVDEIPELNNVYRNFQSDTNIVFISTTFDKQDKVESFLHGNPINYNVVANANEMCDLFNITAFPTNIVIDAEGNYCSFLSGGFPRIGEEITNQINEALESQL